MAFEPTPDQRQAIERKGTVLVSAAAGSGKTAVLVERVVRLLLDPVAPIDADRLLVVTFTNAAAAEMRTRIEKRLAEEQEKDPDNPRLIRQQLLIARASICTIDAFCIELVRDHFQLLGIRPDFKIADPATLSPLREKALTAVLERHYAAGEPDFHLLLETLGADYGDAPVCDAVLKIHASSRCMPFPEEWLAQATACYDTTELQATPWAALLFQRAERDLQRAAGQLTRALERIGDADKIREAYAPSLQAGLLQIQDLAAAAAASDWDGLYEGCRSFAFPALRPLKNCADDGLKEEVKAVRDQVQKQIAKLAARFFAPAAQQEALLKKAAPCVRMLAVLTREYGQELRRLLDQRGALGFDDIEHLALNLLMEKEQGVLRPTAAAKEICRRYDQVLVDEYQDTNNLQDTLFYALSDGGRHLFMVGDVKQSIYRFRHANPENFMNRKNAYRLADPDHPDEGEADDAPVKILLGQNFRSRTGVCDFVNFLFGLLMSKEAGEMDYDEGEYLRPAARFPDREETDAELHLLQSPQEGEKREEAEARYIARYIRSYMDGSPRIRDPRQPEAMRPARLGDFAILLRSPSARAAVYVNELRRQGIPVWADLGGFLQTTELMTFMSLLQVIDNPRREVSLLATLLSPIFGFTPDDVAEIRIGREKMGLYPALLDRARDDAKCKSFVERLREYRRLAVTLPVDRLLQRLYESTGYLSIVLAMPDGARRRANLQLLLDYARAFTADGGGLAAFLRFIEKLGESENLKSAPAAGGEDAVRIMSIHAAKGLQFPVCILAAGSSRFNKSDSTDSLLVHEKGGIGFKICDNQRHVRYTTLAREAISVLTDEASLAEELRLLYVALTRAEEKLVLLVSEDNLERSLRRLAAQIGGNQAGPVEPATVLAARGYADWLLTAALLHPDGAGLRAMCGASFPPVPAEGRLDIRLEDGEDRPASAAETAAREPSAAPDQEEAFGTEEEQRALEERLASRFSYRYPYERLNGLAAKTGVARLVERRTQKAFACTRRPAFLGRSGLTPAERGTAVHAFMQFADYEAAAADPGAELRRLTDRGFLTAEQAAAVDTEVLSAFFSGPLYRRMAAAKQIDREVRFLTELPARQIDPTLPAAWTEEYVVVQGVADCVFLEEDGLVVLDFKTDRVKRPEELAALYAEQLQMYAAALAESYQKPVKECLLYSFRLSASVSVSPYGSDA